MKSVGRGIKGRVVKSSKTTQVFVASKNVIKNHLYA